MPPLLQLETHWSPGPNCVLTVLSWESSKIQLNASEMITEGKRVPWVTVLPQPPKWHAPWKQKTKIQPSVDKCRMVAQRWFYKQNLHDLGVETPAQPFKNHPDVTCTGITNGCPQPTLPDLYMQGLSVRKQWAWVKFSELYWRPSTMWSTHVSQGLLPVPHQIYK